MIRVFEVNFLLISPQKGMVFSKTDNVLQRGVSLPEKFSHMKKTVVGKTIICYTERNIRNGGVAMNERHRRGVKPEPKEEIEGQLEGRNALTEALRSGRTIDKVFIASGETDRALQRLAAQAKEAGAVVVPVDRRKLDAMSFTHAHQGVITLAAAHEYCTIDDILEEAATRGENALIVICDELTDPHNLGAIMRTAECAGAHGVIIPKRRSVGLTATVAKASAGAVEYMKVARVTNINNAIGELKEKGVWIFGTAAEGSVPMYQADLTGPAALVIGNEGEGMSPLVRKNCDVTVHIPMQGRISSLNASAAASILLYEAVRQRLNR